MNKIQKIRSECTRKAKALASSLLKLRDAKGRDANNATLDFFNFEDGTAVCVQTMTGIFPTHKPEEGK